jgi:deoxyribodipyrimidine photo-lyase
MTTAIVLFTRDLRVHDHPALTAGSRTADRVVPLFVLDDHLLGSPFAAPNRLAFLVEALADLDHSLRDRGAALVVRRGDVVREVMALAGETGAGAIHLGDDVSAYARARLARLERERIEVDAHPGTTIVPPGDVVPADGDHFRVFTPYWRRWARQPLRPVLGAPRRLALPPRLAHGSVPRLGELTRAAPSPALPAGGETAARRRLAAWTRRGLERYGELHDDLAADATSRLSPYLRFGCLSPREVLARAGGRPGAEPFVRQLCWRDFHQQVTAANPDMPRADYRDRGRRWHVDEDLLAAWKEGRTGIPLVDAGMRQLAREGWMHNRARLVTASFLTRDLGIDWRAGARHFWDLLVDGEIANNAGNWQWVAGTGNDTRPNRVLNPIRQARRFDPGGDYVRRHVPELAGVTGAAVHEPWKLPAAERRRFDYPDPLAERGGAGRPALF